VPLDDPRPPRVLLGPLEPMVALGMRAVLGEDGCAIVGEEARPAALVLVAGRVRPDAVVLDLLAPAVRELAARVRLAAPEATVVLWARDEDAMEVLDPGADAPRRFSADLPLALREALRSARVAA
jgi:DNA-binding NarL/FixJ family response regulator